MRSERQGKTYVITWEPVQERLAQEFEKQKTACGGRAPGLPRHLSESYRNLRKNNKRACGGRAPGLPRHLSESYRNLSESYSYRNLSESYRLLSESYRKGKTYMRSER